MATKERLLGRLNEIGGSLERRGETLFLLGVGSVGVETDRIDEYSDLDFFVIVKQGYKQRYIERLDWLEDVCPLAYSFRNTVDGYKIMFEDGIYGEYAVFEEEELEHIAYTGARIVWMDPSYAKPDIAKSGGRTETRRREGLDFPLNEALTNLYVGLCRYARGEKLSAARFVQSYAVDSILSVLHLLEKEEAYFPDVFGEERRLEKRFPSFAERVGDMILGYERTPESALHILRYLEDVYPVNRRMSAEIRRLASKQGN
ncbi:hypothetical protein DFQ01_101482 [Paenibacillus cellulosilyticus]|uniref:Nucleotidyltransferase-like protein n=1 Tax=Paenibacillus cellulosilyticus TaxID=375489 RepID=A0A2V2Z3B6_9BACL|nr:hypothetical protein [Paenibacillus cellulosilyticus]PWW08756.1 hypothetical protein DFQ01_101482 [Paenibacillus cellulosilyticus]QKS48314.1 hypothetical protein HUB94_29030 [Paenibacillus cellulosilyticus]